MRPWLRSPVAVAVVAAIAVAGGTPACHRGGVARMKVVVSVFPIYDLVRRVAGPDADVVLVLAPGHGEASFVPGSTESDEAAGARLAVMVGLGFDPWMDGLVKLAAPKAKILQVGDRVPTLTASGSLFAEGDATGKVDPHVWLDPQRASVMTKAIGEELARNDAAHAAAYRRRADEVTDALETLDKDLDGQTRTWQPRGIRAPGFAYFADRYHLRILPSGSGLSVDTLGGGAGAQTYEELLRRDASELGKTLQ